ncbi:MULTISPECIES: hypothetical protein [Bacillus]|nr:hypothetical protein [Bacillus pumilus]MCI4617237.1 hypothetical protein [Bacillus pumilus]MCM3148660.1 hypothetical protein [Bacillus pumilus]MCY7572821.1 hypothetical protein [Bacillus pumilus]MDR6746168.1 hypothetical protein [Bacillus pumilus]MEC3760625.1 hypothetical protein [Bacillus pumilus]
MKNANSIFTRTNRVAIRQFDLQDIEAFYQYRANPSIAIYLKERAIFTKP